MADLFLKTFQPIRSNKKGIDLTCAEIEFRDVAEGSVKLFAPAATYIFEMIAPVLYQNRGTMTLVLSLKWANVEKHYIAIVTYE